MRDSLDISTSENADLKVNNISSVGGKQHIGVLLLFSTSWRLIRGFRRAQNANCSLLTACHTESAKQRIVPSAQKFPTVTYKTIVLITPRTSGKHKVLIGIWNINHGFKDQAATWQQRLQEQEIITFIKTAVESKAVSDIAKYNLQSVREQK